MTTLRERLDEWKKDGRIQVAKLETAERISAP